MESPDKVLKHFLIRSAFCIVEQSRLNRLQNNIKGDMINEFE